MWKEQVLINNKFSEKFSVGDTIINNNGVAYKLSYIGNTHVLCENKDFYGGIDLVMLKSDFLILFGKN